LAGAEGELCGAAGCGCGGRGVGERCDLDVDLKWEGVGRKKPEGGRGGCIYLSIFSFRIMDFGFG